MEATMIWFDPVERHDFIRGTTARFDRMPGEQDDARAVDVSLVQATGARLRGRR
jgi:hypothetical protein